MSVELVNLGRTALLTCSLWIPYVLDRLRCRGLVDTLGSYSFVNFFFRLPHRPGYPAVEAPLSPWAERLKKAHANGGENLAVFAALILANHAAKISNWYTEKARFHSQSYSFAKCSTVYFWSRVFHPILYSLGAPLGGRTVSFFVGYACQVVLALQLII